MNKLTFKNKHLLQTFIINAVFSNCHYYLKHAQCISMFLMLQTWKIIMTIDLWYFSSEIHFFIQLKYNQISKNPIQFVQYMVEFNKGQLHGGYSFKCIYGGEFYFIFTINKSFKSDCTLYLGHLKNSLFATPVK